MTLVMFSCDYHVTQSQMFPTQTMNLLPGQEVVELMVPATKVGLIIGWC